MNRYPIWKNVLIAVILVLGFVYALPNLYGSDPALQISSSRGAEIGELTELQVNVALDKEKIKPTRIELGDGSLLIRFDSEDTQLKAQGLLKKALGRDYVVALNLAPSTPIWLHKLGAEPMFLGLDLRGGVHFLMEVDMEAAVGKAEERYVSDLRSLFREKKVRYKTITRRDEGGVLIRFQDADQQEAGVKLIGKEIPDAMVTEGKAGEYQILLTMSEPSIITTRENA